MFVKTGITSKLREQLISCINLLGEEYTALNFSIFVYEHRQNLEYEKRNNPSLPEETYQQILKGKELPVGLTIPDQKIIHLYKFNLNDIKNENEAKLVLIVNLFHEIRHAWQHENNKFVDEEEIKDIDNNKAKYYGQESERDAYLFQVEQINKHKDSIIRIMEMTQGFDEYKLKKEILELINLKKRSL